MSKRVIIVHGLSGSPDRDFLPWAKEELGKKGYEVIVPSMPDPDCPRIGTWISYLKEVVAEPRESDILIGHSVGCQAILRYLETLPENQMVDKVVLIAGWFNLTNLEKEESEVLNPWLDSPINFAKVKTKADIFLAILSDDDPYVPLEENRKVLEEKLGAKVVVEHGKGHFNDTPQQRPDLLKFF